MAKSSIDADLSADEILKAALKEAFSAAGILSLKNIRVDDRLAGSPSLLAAALPYGNAGLPADAAHPSANPARIAPFARRNYYAEAVARLQDLAKTLRERFGGLRSDYRIICNSPVPEKPLAAAAGIGSPGRNSLIITAEAGSLVVLAAMTLPFDFADDGLRVLPPRRSGAGAFPACGCCPPPGEGAGPACAAACPTGALPGDGTLTRERCIQWYASGHGESVPEDVAAAWGSRLYGCTECQDACPRNRRPIPAAETDRGPLPEHFDARTILAMGDEELRALFRGTAMGLSWLTPAALRRNAALVLRAAAPAGD